MEIINFYFASFVNRLRLLLTVFYLVTTVLIVTCVLRWLGYHYTFLDELNMAVIVKFILSGEILLPMVLFTMYICGSVMISLVVYQYSSKIAYYLMRRRTTTQISIDIVKELSDNGWVVFHEKDKNDRTFEARISRGANFDKFDAHMQLMYYNDFNVGAITRLWSGAACNTAILCFCFFDNTIIYTIIGIISVLWVILCMNFMVGYRVKSEYRPFYESYLNYLSNPHEYPVPLLYFTPESYNKKFDQLRKEPAVSKKS